MSSSSGPGSRSLSASPSQESLPVAWVRVLGAGSIHRDFGHHIATNERGDMLVAARLEPIDKDPPAIDEDTREGPESEDATVDLSAGELRRLTPEGETSWRIPLRATRLLQAPEIALDAAGCAYVAGPYAPHKGALRGAVLWGSFQGNIEFASDLRVSSLPRARYLTRVQADGFVRWADVLRAYGDTPHAVAVAEDVAR